MSIFKPTIDAAALARNDSPLRLASQEGCDWARVGSELSERFSRAPIHLIPATGSPKVAELEALFPDARRIFAVDFYLKGAEKGELLSCGSGYQIGTRVFNIDHHAPHTQWERHVSSGVLACQWVRARGALQPGSGDVVVINHTDCDSVLASMILTGVLPPHERFEQAVLDADHRGAPNEVADLLQACSSTRDLSLLVEALSTFLKGDTLPSQIQERLDSLYEDRLQVKEIAQLRHHEERNGVVFIPCDRYFESELFLPHFPHARIIVVGCPCEKNPDVLLTRLRLGAGVESGASLHRFGITDFDPYYGGRFNAGSNKRGLEAALAQGIKPCFISPREHFERLANC